MAWRLSPTSFDLMAVATDLILLAGVVALGLGSVRALQMARAFVSDAYRSRARWAALLMFTIVIGNLSGFVTFPNNELGGALSYAPFVVLMVVLLIFVDRVIRVAMEEDFFHRDILRWRALGRATYPALLVSLVLGVLASYPVLVSQTTAVSAVLFAAYFQTVVVVPVVFGYAGIALVVGERRTADRVMKRHIRLLGYGILSFVIAFPFFSGNAAEALFANIVTLAADLLLYFSVMSLSSLGRVRPLQEGGAGATPPSPIPGTH